MTCFRIWGLISLTLFLAACTKVVIAPDGTPYDGRGPAPPSAEAPSIESGNPPDGVPPADAAVPPPITLGSDYEMDASEPGRQTSPVVARLSQEAQSQKRSGLLDQALSTAERALRIDPTNPDLWLLLGQVQLERGHYIQAEQLARKSISLAGDDTPLRSRNWRLIQEARRRRGDAAGAEDALKKALDLEGGPSRTN